MYLNLGHQHKIVEEVRREHYDLLIDDELRQGEMVIGGEICCELPTPVETKQCASDPVQVTGSQWVAQKRCGPRRVASWEGK